MPLARALTEADWEQALRTDVSLDEVDTFARIVRDGRPIVLRDDIMGRCFRHTVRTYTRFDLGFDELLTRESADGRVVGLRAGGPAARAGLRSTDVVTSSEYRAGRPEVDAKITVLRDGKSMTVGYSPRGETWRGPGWDRRPDVPDDRCHD